MMQMFNKLMSLINGIIGVLIKIACYVGLIRPHYVIGNVHNTKSTDRKVIISLTSYGRRVGSVLQYTLMSLFRQTIKPDLIILWLDYDNWNINNIPASIKRFQDLGLQIRFCEDIRSYKKLIPTLDNYPDDLIITCDDDIFYKSTMVEHLLTEYKKDPTKIYAHRGHRITYNSHGDLNPYHMWEMEITSGYGYDILPTCGAGCLYSKDLLFRDICNKELFTMLSPRADDLWFYFMAYLQNTPIYIIPNKGFTYIEIDFFYQRFHKNSSLFSTNVGEAHNDTQLRNIVSYYGIESFK